MSLNKFTPSILVLCALCFFILSKNVEASEPSIKLKQAISYRKAGDYQEAIELLSQLRTQNVNHKRINIELALNYIKLQQFQEAEQVVQHLQSMPLTHKEHSTINKIARLLELKLRKSLSVHHFSIDLGLASGIDQTNSTHSVYFYDDFQYEEEYWFDETYDETIGLTDEIDYVEYIETDDYWDREKVSEQSEVSYQRVFIHGNYRYRPKDNIMFLGLPTLWTIDNDLTFDRRHLNQADNNQQTNYQFDSSLYLLQLDRWLVELNFQTSIHQRVSKKLLRKARARLALTLPFGSIKLKLAVDRQSNDYHNTLQTHDAHATTPWLEVTYRFASQYRLISGVKYRHQKARDPFNSYTNEQAYLGIYYVPSAVFNAYLLYRRDNLKYVIDDYSLVNWAKERKRSFAFGIGYHINSNVSVNLSADLGDKHIELGFGDDDWRRVEASLIYRF